LLYTTDLPTSPESTTATFADDTAVVAMDSDPAIASQKLQTDPLAIQDWFKKWRMKANQSKIQGDLRSIHYTKRNVPPGPNKQCATPTRRCPSILAYTLTGDLPATNTFSQNGNN
jgi:hypothetical protein